MTEQNHLLSRRTFVGGAAVLGASLCLPAITPLSAHAVTAAEKQAEASAALEKLNALNEQFDHATETYNAALMDQEAAQSRMDEAQTRIDEASARIGVLQDHLGTRARSMYRSGSTTFLDLLLGATSFQAFAQNWDLLNDMNENDASMVSETKTLRAEVESEKAVYEEQRNVAAAKAQEAEESAAKADALVQEAQNVYDSLSAEAAQLLAEEEAAREAAALEAARRAEEEAARQAAAEEANRGNSNSSSNSSSNSNSSSGNGGNNNGNSSSGNGGSNSGNSGNSGGSNSSSSGSGSGSSSSGSSNNSKPQSVSGGTVVSRAQAQLGKPYVRGGVGPDSYDCSGLVGYCLTGEHKRWCTTGTIEGWTRVSNPQPGDICIRPGHTGVYIGGGQMIHASTPKTGVIVGSVKSNMWYVRY
ncbi:NlpC/P60 family protein [Adlercreutzia sp. R21]|uniref:C40 family peptidase n=1 Tax=Adlercreutzia wanghongyangiae TaxID=3111451 RepID=UPI002DBB4182|nr:NlpC/P60 family protein [Adlercreutzia sp. R21]MEC4184597.1 NlpC/P60 family protein [Adlercreutzia sp. R21]